MSGVFAKKFGRKYWGSSDCVSCVMYSISSALVFRQVKYVYDCEKPSFASASINRGRVNASERKITSGKRLRTSRISHSQNGSGFVCGLSTRKTVTPQPTQCSTTSSSACQRPCQSSLAKSTL